MLFDIDFNSQKTLTMTTVKYPILLLLLLLKVQIGKSKFSYISIAVYKIAPIAIIVSPDYLATYLLSENYINYMYNACDPFLS